MQLYMGENNNPALLEPGWEMREDCIISFAYLWNWLDE